MPGIQIHSLQLCIWLKSSFFGDAFFICRYCKYCTGRWDDQVCDSNAPCGPKLISWSWALINWDGQLGPGVEIKTLHALLTYYSLLKYSFRSTEIVKQTKRAETEIASNDIYIKSDLPFACFVFKADTYSSISSLWTSKTTQLVQL